MLIALDTETYLIGPGYSAPTMVCCSWATAHGRGLEREPPAPEVFEHHTVFANAPFDLAVFMVANPALTRPIFDALDAGRIHDVQTRQKLADLRDGCFSHAKGAYSLAGLVGRHLGIKLAKEDTWRLRYHDLDHLPTAQWPADAVEYALDDAKATLDVFEAQEMREIEIGREGTFADEAAQVRAHMALHLMTCRGMRLDAAHLRKTQAYLEARIDQLAPEAYPYVWCDPATDTYKVRQKLVRPAVAKALGGRAKLVPAAFKRVRDGQSTREAEVTAGNVVMDAESLKTAASMSDDPQLKAISDFKTAQKLLSTYVVPYSRLLCPADGGSGIGIAQPQFQILVETGRTSAYSPNVQNLPKGSAIRRCFTARPGHVLIACDFAAAELHTLAQTCLTVVGYSKLAEALNAGLDPHLEFAANHFLNVPYAQALAAKEAGDKDTKEARQVAKAANFGFPGGLGAMAFRFYAANYGARLTLFQAEQVKAQYERQWPEVSKYHEIVKRGLARYGTLKLPSGRYRANVTFTQAANTGFQGPAADGAKAAAWAVTRTCFLDHDSPLFGVRPVNFVHDEVIVECPEDRAHEAALELQRVMSDEFTRVATPDVPTPAEATIMRSWTKADPVWRDGRLIPVEDAA